VRAENGLREAGDALEQLALRSGPRNPFLTNS
jgi:hypothetical protein